MRVDPRAGSRDLYAPLVAAGVRGVELGRLDFGDVHLEGRGPEGCPVQVGVEYKKLPDLVQCIDNGRYVGHQLPGMLGCYDQVWLLVEGIWRVGAHGLVEVPRGGSWRPLRAGVGSFTANALDGFLFTLEIKLGVRVMRTGTLPQTVHWLSALNRWWTGKEYDEHKAHLAFDNSAAIATCVRPSLLRRIVKELPGVGWNRSGAVASHFGSVVEMVMAPESEWVGIPGVGKGTARKVREALDGK